MKRDCIIMGSPIMRFKMPPQLIDDYNSRVDELIKNDSWVAKSNNAKLSFKASFANYPSQMLRMPLDSLLKNYESYWNQVIRNYLSICKKSGLHMGAILTKGTKIREGWVNRMFAGDYMPDHSHPNDNIFGITGCLKEPRFNPAVDRDGDFILNKGALTFTSGPDILTSRTTATLYPQVGEGYVFPAWMVHRVYPHTGDTERRTFAFNVGYSDSD